MTDPVINDLNRYMAELEEADKHEAASYDLLEEKWNDFDELQSNFVAEEFYDFFGENMNDVMEAITKSVNAHRIQDVEIEVGRKMLAVFDKFVDMMYDKGLLPNGQKVDRALEERARDMQEPD